MALSSGFEGSEKRLELRFSVHHDRLGLRRLPFESLQRTLDAVQCTVVSAIGNSHFDAYVLSESSLFVYPEKIVLKTCGTTRLLRSIPCFLRLAHCLGISLSKCRYTRGSFVFPHAQPFPHTSFSEEVRYLEEALPTARLRYRKASVLPSTSSSSSSLSPTSSHSWHVYTASSCEESSTDHVNPGTPHGQSVPSTEFTLEVCMTQLDRDLATRFHRGGGDVAGREMTELTGIDQINPRATICDFGFDPCGYSMNGLDGRWYSTIHVTPEDGYSYASFECNGEILGEGGQDEAPVEKVLQKVVEVFQPGKVSVSVSVSVDCLCGCDGGSRVASKMSGGGVLKTSGLSCRGRKVEEFPGGEKVVYQTYAARRNWIE